MGNQKNKLKELASRRKNKRKKVFFGARSADKKKLDKARATQYLMREGVIMSPSSAVEPNSIEIAEAAAGTTSNIPLLHSTPHEEPVAGPSTEVPVPPRPPYSQDVTPENRIIESNRPNQESNVTEKTPELSVLFNVPKEGVKDLPKNRIVNLAHFFGQIQNDKHPGFFECNIMHLEFQGEVFSKKHSCLMPLLQFKCKMCGSFRNYSLQPDDEDLDAAVVNGTISAGIGYTAAAELFSAFNLPFMSPKKYTAVATKVSEHISASLLESMTEAGKEEKALAEENGDVLKDGTPFITVVTDGSWAKRSYKNQFNSRSGMASIIGLRTRKALFVGIKNKYCAICDHSSKRNTTEEVPKHKCYKNWNKSSTAMETAVVLEGFKCSKSMHGLVYRKVIGDNDSSVYKTLKVCMPYGPDVPIQKIECRNHLLRNMVGHLRGMAKNTKYPLEQRKGINSNLLRFRTSVRGAVNYWKSQSLSQAILQQNLSKDIRNIYRHIFGDHSNCSQYFCKGKAKGEQPLYWAMEGSGLAKELDILMKRLSHHADSLLVDVDSNFCEHLNSIISKQIGGKRIFYGARGLYNCKVEAAALQFNEGDLVEHVSRQIQGGRTPGSKTKRFVRRRFEQRERLKKFRKKLTYEECIAKKSRHTISGPDSCYGLANVIEDDDDHLEELKENHLKKLALENPDKIQEKTENQNQSDAWFTERKKRLTASNFYKVMSLKPVTNTRNTVYSILYSNPKSDAIDFGRSHEAEAKRMFEAQTGMTIKNCGLYVDKKYPFLGASPDGLVGKNAIVEVKCLYAASMTNCGSLDEAIADGKVPELEKGRKLKRKSWFYQIHGQLNVTNRDTCHLVLFAEHWPRVEVIVVKRDKKLWIETMVPKLEKFFKTALLPEIVSPRYDIALDKTQIRDSYIVM